MRKGIIVAICLLLATSIVYANARNTVELTGSGGSGTATVTQSRPRDGVTGLTVNVRVSDVTDEPGRVLEGWLVDVDTDTKLSLGGFALRRAGSGSLRFRQSLVNPHIYDKVVITQEPINDIDPAPGLVLMEGDIPNSVGTLWELSTSPTGRQEVPTARTRAFGRGTFTIDTVANTLMYEVVYANLQGTETAAHIHGFAPPGVNAAVLFDLGVGNPKAGTVSITEAQQTDLIAGLGYVNIHSDVFPAGEIRGQIT